MATDEQDLRPGLVVEARSSPPARLPEGIDRLCVNTIRVLAIDAVEAAGSGHPGTPMALAPLGYVLWTRYLRHDPSQPGWPDRDRFVLSAGHASMLLYALLHLCGYDLGLEELRRFRQWGSRCAGHPERGLAPGVEVTTGPLGQGVANAVGLAVAERHLAARYNRPDHAVVDHRTWVICSDGDLMEGVSAEAASLAGSLGLSKLVLFYDDNHITIEGSTELAFREQVGRRFEAYGWRVLDLPDVNDLDGVCRVIEEVLAPEGRPTLVVAHSVIGYGAPTKQGTAAAHGAPLGAAEARAAKRNLGWPYLEPFTVPPEVAEAMRGPTIERGQAARRAWEGVMGRYRRAYPQLAGELERALAGMLPDDWAAGIPVFPASIGAMATRKASGIVLNAIAPAMPELIGGSADLAPSTDTYLEGEPDIGCGDFGGRNFHFGVREHAMTAVLNGLAAHGGLRPFGATFLGFSDYARPAIRMAALMGLPVVLVFTHDSIGLGEDGPTHQPVEHLVALRAVPNLVVIRPADANETAQAWQVALERRDSPTALVLSRQGLPVLGPPPRGAVARGAYVVADGTEVAVVATGSEVQLALGARDRLGGEGISARVVSMPSWELFDAERAEYQHEVLPPLLPVVAVEAGRSLGWCRWAQRTVGLDRFGASAPGEVVFAEFGLTADHVAEAARQLLAEGAARGEH